MAATVYTIGYAGRRLPDFIQALQEAGVERVIDVRALPLSRRKGFSKTSLGESLANAGIEYVHLRSAGNPYRDQKNDIKRCLALYAKHIDANPIVIDDVEAAMRGRPSALLCFEADACECHRSVLVDHLTQRNPSRRIRHL